VKALDPHVEYHRVKDRERVQAEWQESSFGKDLTADGEQSESMLCYCCVLYCLACPVVSDHICVATKRIFEDQATQLWWEA